MSNAVRKTSRGTCLALVRCNSETRNGGGDEVEISPPNLPTSGVSEVAPPLPWDPWTVKHRSDGLVS